MPSTTLAQYRTRVAAKLGLDNDANTDQPLIDSWLNEGYEDVLSRTHCKVSSATMSLSAGSGDYTLSTSILAMLDVTIDSAGQEYAFERTTVEDILRKRRVSASSDSPARWYAVDGSNLLLVYPTPSAADEITVYYVPRPTALSATADAPTDVPAEFHKLLEWYALAEGADYDDDQSSAQGQRYRDYYEQGLIRLKKALRFKGGRRLSPARVGRTRHVPHDNSTDWRR